MGVKQKQKLVERIQVLALLEDWHRRATEERKWRLAKAFKTARYRMLMAMRAARAWEQ